MGLPAEQIEDNGWEASQHNDYLMFEKSALEFFAEVRKLSSCVPDYTWITEKDVDNVMAGCLPHLWNEYMNIVTGKKGETK